MFKKFNRIFKTKKIIVVSDNNIKTTEVNNFHRLIRFLVFSWCLFTSIFFIFNSRIQAIKNDKIDKLKSINLDLNDNITNLTSLIKNIEDYLVSLNFYDRFNDIDIKKISDVKNKLKNDSYITSEEYKQILPIIDNLERKVTNIDTLINLRISGINNILKEVSLDNKARELYSVNYSDSSEIKTENSIFKNSMLIKSDTFNELKSNINYLKFLEYFLNSIPISKPMKNYYLSSKFGTRIDPFTKKVKVHNGLDFAGPYNSVVYAPADGVVKFTGIRGGFGNSLSIDHENDIVTDYAHLGKILVKNGDKVKRGDKIGIQGSTGRSTGQHLHWEVKVDNNLFDPLKFIKVGEKIF